MFKIIGTNYRKFNIYSCLLKKYEQKIVESKYIFKKSKATYSTQKYFDEDLYKDSENKNVYEAKKFDYIIIGAGSAGCVLLNRLSENPNLNILLIEAGKRDTGYFDSWKIAMPSALTYNISNEKYDWNYKTEPQVNLGNRRLTWPRGKLLGGSSSLNAMCYIRGNPLDYERWSEVVPEWGYLNVLPYFKKAQTHQLGENEYRGGNGPLYVSRIQSNNKLFDGYINAGIDCGYSYTEDFNGFKQEGFGPLDATIKNGIRCSSSYAYLREIENRRRNIQIQSEAIVTKILFTDDFERQSNKIGECFSGKKAIGVEVFYTKTQQTNKIYVNKEVILSGGAINTPQILMLSGIGYHEELDKLGIKVLHNLPEVGKNLQDHLEVYLQHKCKEPLTLSTVLIFFS